MDTRIRRCGRGDWAAIVAIYNQAVAEGGKTADTEPLTVEQRHEWLAQHEGGSYPIFVAEAGGRVVGFCSLSAHRPGRRALRRVAEISYYIDRDHRRRGVGQGLVAHALRRAPDYGFRHVFALLLDVNEASIRLLEQTGFVKWGHLPGIAEFDDYVCGQVIYGRSVEA